MLKLNLTNKEASHIKWEVSSFPDGQQDIRITGLEAKAVREWGVNINKFPVTIMSRFNGFKDLELIIAATKAIRRIDNDTPIHLYIPYLLGARSDRQFQEGGTSYLVDVVAPILNSLNFSSIEVLDVHSDVAAACINNLKVTSNEILVRKAIDTFFPCSEGVRVTDILQKFVLVSPDAGASKKIEKLANKIGYTGDIITCSKSRGLDGKLSKTIVPLTTEIGNKDLIIIDDICDGGATFLNIAKEVRFQRLKLGLDSMNEFKSNAKIYLIVTHGIFSKGLKCLDVFDGIYTTNSIQDLGVDDGDAMSPYRHKVKQLNVF